MKKNNNMFYLVVLIICISIAILARIMNPGWILIAGILTYGIGPAYIYFFFVINYNMINSNNYKEIKNILFIASCITFLVAFIVYPDFLDSPNSTRAVFGTISDKNVLYEFKSIGFNSIIINAIINLISFVFIYTSREPEKNKFGKILIPNFIKHDKNLNEIKNKLIDNKQTEKKEVKPIKISLTKLIFITLLLIAVLVGVILIVINMYTK